MAIIPRAIFATFFLLFLVSPLCCMAKNLLYVGQSLKTGESLTAGNFTFVVQADCNLVLYDNDSPIWASDTGGIGRTHCHLTFETNSDVLVFDRNDNLVFESRNGLKEGNYVLILQKNGKLVIYGPKRWPEDSQLMGTVFGSDLFTSFGALPANKNAEKAKAAAAAVAARFTMFVSN